MINDTKEPTKDHKNTQKEILQEITEIFMEEILDMVNQNLQVALRKFQDTKNKEQEKTQKQISELRGALNKHHSETEVTIKREISELKKKIKY
jgi:ribosomal protein L31E